MPTPSADTLAEALRPLTEAPRSSAIFLDVDGTLAPIVDRAEQARVPERTALLLGRLGRRYGVVACVSGRTAGEARRLVGVGSIAYAGTHGAELLERNAALPELLPELAGWTQAVRAFSAARHGREERMLRIRLEDKGPIAAFHWRGSPDEDAARASVERIAAAAEEDGFAVQWGRKVLEVRPPVPIDKGRAVRELVARHEATAALFAGDDTTDLDGFAALDGLLEEDVLEGAVRVGVSSDEGPAAITERADLVVAGVEGFVGVLDVLAEEV